MRVIELTKGQVAIVDDEDFERLAQWRWFLHSGGYAVRSQHGKRPFTIYMHREIIGCEAEATDHINGNKLDNRRCNLRPATQGQNACNSKLRRDNTTGSKGVSFYKRYGKYHASILSNGKSKFLGYFDSFEQAKVARDAAALQLHGEFARNN